MGLTVDDHPLMEISYATMSWSVLLQTTFAAVMSVFDTVTNSTTQLATQVATQVATVLVRIIGARPSGIGVGALPVAKTGLPALDYYILHRDIQPVPEVVDTKVVDTEVVDTEVSARIWIQFASTCEGDAQLVAARMKLRLGYCDYGSCEFPAPRIKSLRSMPQLSQAAALRNGRTSNSHMLPATLIDEILHSIQTLFSSSMRSRISRISPFFVRRLFA
ncbi:uncharacterized protein V1518DRAFT_406111 [Limtongia smithiae]|uniref:uncharacterized protein n=1 Tax=Limtongia smithiae TaxID=1125753 RepID=UPI0034CD0A9C